MTSDRTREIAALATWAAGLFLFAAVGTYREGLPPGEAPALSNACGAIGQAVAGFLLHRFGLAVWLIVLGVLAEGIRLFRKAEVRPLPLRLPGVVLFLSVCAAGLTHFFQGTTSNIPDPGGDVGLALNGLLTHDAGLGALGGRIAWLFLFLTTLLLATDFLYSRSCALLVEWYRERGGMAGILRFGSGGGAALATAGATGSGTAGATVTSTKTRTRKASKVEEEPEADDVALSDEEEWEDEDEADEEWDEDEEEDDEDWDETALDDDEEWEDEEWEDEEEEDEDEPVEEEVEIPLVLPKQKPPKPLEVPTVDHAGPAPAPTPVTEKGQPYRFPPLDLLEPAKSLDLSATDATVHKYARKLTTVLQSFKIDARVVGVQRGPTITMLEVELAAGTKLGRLRSLEDDLAMNLAAQSVRIVAPIPGKSTAGIEVPNEQRETVSLRELLEWKGYKDEKYAIPIMLGKDSAGQPLITDLAAMPHMLVAGSTGAGKSVCLNTMIMSILYKRTPEQVKMILIDPKMVELSLFQNVPHLMCPVVTDMKRAASILEWAVEKMEARYQLLHQVGVRNIYSYNKLGEKKLRERMGDEFPEDMETTLPFIVIVIDELADLMMNCAKDVEQSITRLAQKSRAVGIHVILATQRPSTNVITGLIKANLPTRIGFRVASKIDSRVILDANGAEKLLGAGDMLYLPPRSADLVRAQGTFVDDAEIHDVVAEIAEHCKPIYSAELIQKRSKNTQDPSDIDPLFDEAARFIVETQRGSASLLQRKYQIGYTRASRLIDLMAGEALLGDYKGSQAREVLVTLEELEQRRTEQLSKRAQGRLFSGGSQEGG